MTTNFNNLIDPFRALLNYQPTQPQTKPQVPVTQARPVAQPTTPQTFQLGPINTGTPASFLSPHGSPVVPPGQKPVIPNYGTASISALPSATQRAPIQNLALKPEAFGPAAPIAPTAPVTSGYTIQRGDTLSAIAQRSGISLNELLSLNPQYKANPNLIIPGQTVNLKGSTGAVQKPTTPVAPAMPTGATINPATGGITSAPEMSAGSATPAVPPAPVSPFASSPLPFTSPEYETAMKEYEKNIPITPEEESTYNALANLESGLAMSKANISNQPIPLEFITGQQASVERRALALTEPLTKKAALLQAKRTGALEASKFKLDIESGKLGALRDASKPVSVAMGSSLINPLTGKTVASGGSYTDKQAYDTFFNIAQTYPDANIKWNDTLTPQQNLEMAQARAAQSPSFQAKNTIYAINPLTGEPMIISKMGGGGAFGGGTQAPAGVSEANLAPELKSALTNVAGVKFFDASKVTSAQLPYLQRAAQQMGTPLLSKEDANKVQDALQSFSSANTLIQQVSTLASPVLTASDNAGAQTIQAARLKAIELAPSLSTDNNAKQFISARNSMLSLLTRAAGEKGVLTTQDVERIAQAMPGYSDSATLAAQKAANFSTVVNSVLQGAIQAYIGTTSGGEGASGAGSGADNDPLGLF